MTAPSRVRLPLADAALVINGEAALGEGLLAAVVIDGDERGSFAGGFAGKPLQVRWAGRKLEGLTAERLASLEFEVAAGQGSDTAAPTEQGAAAPAAEPDRMAEGMARLLLAPEVSRPLIAQIYAIPAHMIPKGPQALRAERTAALQRTAKLATGGKVAPLPPTAEVDPARAKRIADLKAVGKSTTKTAWG